MSFTTVNDSAASQMVQTTSLTMDLKHGLEISALVAALENFRSSMKSSLAEFKQAVSEGFDEMTHIHFPLESTFRTTEDVFTEESAQKTEIKKDSPQPKLESPISDSPNVSIGFTEPPIVGKIKSCISPLVPRTRFNHRPSRMVVDDIGLGLVDSISDKQLFDPGGCLAESKGLGFAKPTISLKEKLARTTLRNLRSQGHTYIELREDGRWFTLLGVSKNGVSKNASEGEIRKIFYELAKELHPDIKADDPVAETKFQEISNASEILKNKEKCDLYDQIGHDLGKSVSHIAGKELEFKDKSYFFTRFENHLLLGESGQYWLGNSKSGSSQYQIHHASSPNVILKSHSVVWGSHVSALDLGANTIVDSGGSIASTVSYSLEFNAGEASSGAEFMPKSSQAENVAVAGTIIGAKRTASFSSSVLALPGKTTLFQLLSTLQTEALECHTRENSERVMVEVFQMLFEQDEKSRLRGNVYGSKTRRVWDPGGINFRVFVFIEAVVEQHKTA